jgi:phospholipid-binding lipoprotein MlaA
MRERRRAAALLAAAVLLAPAAARANDPLEELNRRVHSLNLAARAHVVGPLAELYLARVPPRVRDGTANLLANLAEPITAASGLAAGEWALALNAAARFGVNTTLGLGGLRDPATAMGYPRRGFTVADAVCRWGVPSGPFLVLPLLGPSTLRDGAAAGLTGLALTQALGADAVLAWSGTDGFVQYAEAHPELARLEAQSLDGYAAMRSAHLQRRAARCPVDHARLAAAEAAEGAGPE